MSISIAFGIHPVKEALKNNKKVHKIIVQKGLNSEAINEIISLAKEVDIPFQFVPKEKLNYLTKENHQGVIAQLSAIEYYDIEKLLPNLLESKDNPLILLLDGVTDVRNIGAITRSAECFGVDAIYIPTFGSAIINEDAIKASAGALFTVPIARGINFNKGVEFIQNCGFQLISITEKGEDSVNDVDFSIPTAVSEYAQ
jgi:23S rRNA (guanosine2251-2'-O)-methyltransferase